VSERRVLFLCTGNYFRSRFAEILFNHLASRAGLAIRAESAGLVPRCHARNVGPISPHTLAGLRARGIDPPEDPRAPRDVTEEDLAAAELVIAVKETEHRPFVQQYFPAWSGRIHYWDVDDVPHVAAANALSALEEEVRALLAKIR
jgi:protein-tyrosine phosphatase